MKSWKKQSHTVNNISKTISANLRNAHLSNIAVQKGCTRLLHFPCTSSDVKLSAAGASTADHSARTFSVAKSETKPDQCMFMLAASRSGTNSSTAYCCYCSMIIVLLLCNGLDRNFAFLLLLNMNREFGGSSRVFVDQSAIYRTINELDVHPTTRIQFYTSAKINEINFIKSWTNRVKLPSVKCTYYIRNINYNNS